MICTICKKERPIVFPTKDNKDYKDYDNYFCQECWKKRQEENAEINRMIDTGELKPFAELLITECENGDIICKEMK